MRKKIRNASYLGSVLGLFVLSSVALAGGPIDRCKSQCGAEEHAQRNRSAAQMSACKELHTRYLAQCTQQCLRNKNHQSSVRTIQWVCNDGCTRALQELNAACELTRPDGRLVLGAANMRAANTAKGTACRAWCENQSSTSLRQRYNVSSTCVSQLDLWANRYKACQQSLAAQLIPCLQLRCKKKRTGQAFDCTMSTVSQCISKLVPMQRQCENIVRPHKNRYQSLRCGY